MNKKCLIALLTASIASPAWSITYNDTITAIFGSGNPDTAWTSQAGPNGMELALRGKPRTTSIPPNTNGIYSFATGTVGTGTSTRAIWNWEFSINSGNVSLDSTYDYYVGIDLDPTQGVNLTVVNAMINPYWSDNEYGTSSTLNGAGLKPSEVGFTSLSNYTISQNSQNLVFAGGNPFLNATYDYQLFAVAKTDPNGAAGVKVANVGIQVVVGTGGTAVPDSGSTLVLIGGLLASFAFFGSRRRS